MDYQNYRQLWKRRKSERSIGEIMADEYFIVEYTEGSETWRSQAYKDSRLAQLIGNKKQKAQPDKIYRLELRQDKSLKW